jgi:hypothetical protein
MPGRATESRHNLVNAAWEILQYFEKEENNSEQNNESEVSDKQKETYVHGLSKTEGEHRRYRSRPIIYLEKNNIGD